MERHFLFLEINFGPPTAYLGSVWPPPQKNIESTTIVSVFVLTSSSLVILTIVGLFSICVTQSLYSFTNLVASGRYDCC